MKEAISRIKCKNCKKNISVTYIESSFLGSKSNFCSEECLNEQYIISAFKITVLVILIYLSLILLPMLSRELF